MNKTNYSSGSKRETIVGYSRAVKIGNIVEVTGTVAVDGNDLLVGEDDAYTRAKFIIEKIEKVLAKARASLKDVVRIRIFVTDIPCREEFGKVHGKFFLRSSPVRL